MTSVTNTSGTANRRNFFVQKLSSFYAVTHLRKDSPTTP